MCILALFLVAGAIEAQTPATGAISGQVLDSSEAAVAGARVFVSNEDTGQTRTLVTGLAGAFRASACRTEFSITVEVPNFEKQTVRPIRVSVTETTAVDVRLKVGSVATQIEVSGSDQLAQTENATLGRVTDSQTIVALPLANRNFAQILALYPGVVVELPNAAALGSAYVPDSPPTAQRDHGQ